MDINQWDVAGYNLKYPAQGSAHETGNINQDTDFELPDLQSPCDQLSETLEEGNFPGKRRLSGIRGKFMKAGTSPNRCIFR